MFQNIKSIIIQDISEKEISLEINGEVKKIKSQLDELKKLIQAQEGKTVQYADKIYNIESINEANFGILQRSKQAQVFNEKLSKRLIEAIAPHKKGVQRFLNQAQQEHQDWEKQEDISDTAKKIIAYSFVGPLGIHLSKLIAIGKENPSDEKQEIYLRKCLEIAHISLDLLSFILLSALWERQSQKPPIALEESASQSIRNFFESTFSYSLTSKYEFLQTLLNIFQQHQIPMPLPEMQAFAQVHSAKDSPFAQICQRLHSLKDKIARNDFNLLDCAEAEENIAEMFQILYFLATYKMASVKNIHYNRTRSLNERYLHQYAALGIDNKANVDAEKRHFMPEPVSTESILLYKKDYQEALNLFPFIIDYNTLTLEDGAKICFYSKRDSQDNSLHYRFLEDNSLQNIVLEKIGGDHYSIEDFMESPDKFKDLSKLIKEDKNRIRFHLNYVYLLFEQAENTILSQNPSPKMNFNPEDFYDDED